MQYLVSEYPKEEVLKIVAEHASKNLPEGTPEGIIRAGLKSDGSVEVRFIPQSKDCVNN